MNGQGSFIPPEWLQERLSIEQAEAEYAHDGVAVSEFAEEWDRLKTLMIEGDEIWSFCSSAQSWKNLCGTAGIALVRDGRPIDGFDTMMN